MLYVRLFAKIFLRLVPAVLSGDLLYLYYAGAWIEPIRFIEIAELVMLYAFVAIYLIVTVRFIRRLATHGYSSKDTQHY